MNDQPIKHVVCAFRSRPTGEVTVEKGISLAREAGARLTFFQVVDVQFLASITTKQATLKAIFGELADMAEFEMLIVTRHARLQGVEEVDFLIGRGNVREELLRIARELQPDVMVVGRPRPSPGRDTFTQKEMDELVEELRRDVQIQVIQAIQES